MIGLPMPEDVRPFKAAEVVDHPANLATQRSNHKLPTFFQRPDRIEYPLYVITPVINAVRSRERWKSFQDFKKHITESGAIIYTVEVAFGDRDFAVTSPDDPHDIQLRTFHELWMKERAINIGVAHLTRQVPDWRAVSWIDADCHFARYDWANETLHLLQRFPILQLWSQIFNLDSQYQLRSTLVSFMSVQMKDKNVTGDYYDYDEGSGQKYGSPGLAWAARREAWDQLPGGLLDVCVLGAGDFYWASAMQGTLEKVIGQRNDLTPPFQKVMHQYSEHLQRTRWQERCLVGSCGLLRGACLHFWHGEREDRKYKTRGDILMRHSFDPARDLKPEGNMLWTLTDRSPDLRREIQLYFEGRQEDRPSN